jgi:hypothetical protein
MRTSKIPFSQIPNKLKYPASIKGTLSSIHSIIISHVVQHYINARTYRIKVIDVMNNLTYHVLVNDDLGLIWNKNDPLKLSSFVDYNVVRKNIGQLYLEYSDIEFDIDETDDANVTRTKSSNPMAELKAAVETTPKKKSVVKSKTETVINSATTSIPTPKEDLYIKYPTVPQININEPYISQYINGEIYTIYKSLPLIPMKQCEISATTNVEIMSNADLLKLYPNRIIRTRDECMYEHVDNMYQHDILGNILPIEGYTRAELIDNIVRYPHIFRLCRIVDNEIVNMYSSIEIEGELYRTMDIWDSLPEATVIPRSASYIKEYVVRRYLIEETHGIKHKYPIFGAFDEFMTLFMPSDDYIALGYKDVIGMAKQCVISRVAYKRSRNPILRAIGGQ